MKKISFLLCSFLASVTLLAGELTDGYEKVTDISSLTSSDKVILYCDESEVGVSGFSGYKDANVSSDAADWIQYEVTPVSGGVLLYDSNAAQYIVQPGGNSFLYGTDNPMTCNISNGVFGGLDGTTQRYLCRNEDPTNGTFHRFYPNTNSTATTTKYPFYIYKVVEETPDIPIGKELTDGYEKVTDISSLRSNDKIVLYCDGAEVGVNGFSGYKDANVSSNAVDWVQYEVTPVSGGVLLYDSNAAQYIVQPGGNSFLYGTSNPMTCNISNGVFGGLDGTTQRYLCRNEDPTNGTFHRFYPNTNSTATTNKYPFYIYKVVEETPDIPTDGGEVWQVADEGWWGGNIIASSGTYKQVGSFNHFNAYVYDGAADWQMHTYAGTFIGMDGVTYETDYIQGGTNGMKGHLMHANGICAHLKLCPQSDGWVYIAARYGMNKPVWAAKVPNSVINSGTLDYANMTPYLMPGFSEAIATDTGVVMTKAMYIREDGRGLWTREGSSDATPAAIPLQLENGYTYFFWLSGSKLMLCGLHTIWGDIDVPVETDALQYTITSTNPNTAEVSGYTGNATDVVIPENVTINGTTYSVTSIGFGAFYFCDGLTSVTIPNSVTSIGGYAFSWCTSLNSVTIPDGVTSIGEGTFEGCTGLTSVIWNAKNCADPYLSYAPFSSISSQITSFTFGNDVEHIPAYLCYDMSSLTSITIPKNVTSIGDNAFSGCSALISVIWNAKNCADFGSWPHPFNTYDIAITSFMFGDDVESIPAYLCYNMDKLTSVSISNSVKTIGESAFSGCANLTSIAIPNSVTTIGSETFCECGKLTSVTIGNSVRSIGDMAFSWCHGLTAITIPGNVTSIGVGAFIYCSNLISITIPSSVISIGNRAFAACEGLTSIVVENGNTMYDSRNNCNAIIETATNTLISGCKNTIIPNNVTSIGNWAFGGCYGLTSITIPNSVTSIGDMAFGGCYGLTSVTIPESVTSIGEEAFADCINLASVNIVNGVKSIGLGAFWNSSLTSITLPNSVTTIGDYAFHCEQLTEIRCAAKLPPRIVDEDGNIMSNNAKLVSDYNATTLYVPCESQAAYYNHANWGLFNTIECMDENKYAVSVTCNADEGTVLGAGTYAEGTEVTLAAIPNKGYEFILWSDGNTDNPRKIVVTGDVNLAAIFAKENTAIDDAVSDQPAVSKIIRNGQVCILRDGKVYDIMGNQIQ